MKDKLDAIGNTMTVFVIGLLGIVSLYALVGTIYVSGVSESKELLTPNYTVGARIEGTNYVVHNGDTLKIHKHVHVSYTYQKMTDEERVQAREEIRRRK